MRRILSTYFNGLLLATDLIKWPLFIAAAFVTIGFWGPIFLLTYGVYQLGKWSRETEYDELQYEREVIAVADPSYELSAENE